MAWRAACCATHRRQRGAWRSGASRGRSRHNNQSPPRLHSHLHCRCHLWHHRRRRAAARSATLRGGSPARPSGRAPAAGPTGRGGTAWRSPLPTGSSAAAPPSGLCSSRARSLARLRLDRGLVVGPLLLLRDLDIPCTCGPFSRVRRQQEAWRAKIFFAKRAERVLSLYCKQEDDLRKITKRIGRRPPFISNSY